jgi:ankyrin repeat protein
VIGEADKAPENRWKIAEVLLANGANPNYCKPLTQMTALHLLAFNNDSEAIKTLLSHRADMTAQTHDGNFPIDVAGTTPSLQSVDTLLEHYQTVNNIMVPDSGEGYLAKKVNDLISGQHEFLGIFSEESALVSMPASGRFALKNSKVNGSG